MVMQAIRQRSQGIVAYILVGLIALVFGLFGFGSITTFLVPTPSVLTINGVDIPEQEMRIRLERRRAGMLANGLAIDEERLSRLVLDELVRDALLDESVRNLRLHFGDEQVGQVILSNQAFQVDGTFNPEQYQFAIAQAGYSPITFRELVRSEQIHNQLINVISGSEFTLTGEAEWFAGLIDQTRDLAYLRLEVDRLMGEVTVGEDEVKSYYDEHPAAFTSEESVRLEYLELNLDDLQASIELSAEDLTDWYQQNQEIYGSPEERRVAHLLFEFGEDARSRAEAAYARLQAGEDFASLAKELSDDSGSASQGGELGFAAAGTYADEFETALDQLSVGEVTRPVETNFGFHLIKLLEIREARITPLDEVRDQVRKRCYQYPCSGNVRRKVDQPGRPGV